MSISYVITCDIGINSRQAFIQIVRLRRVGDIY